jgi:hypothetical protein
MARYCIVFISLIFPSQVLADDGLAILQLSFHRVPPALATQIRQKLQDTLNEDGYDVMPQRAAVRVLRGAGVPPGCVIGPCLNRVKETLKVKRIVVGGVLSQGTSYDITMTMLEAGGGTTLSQVNKRCNVCNFMEVEKTVVDLSKQLHKQALVFLATRSNLGVRSRPAGAKVMLDGLAAGQTPLVRVLTPGSHSVEVAKKGYSAASQTVHLEAGKPHTINVTLVPEGTGNESTVTFEGNSGDESSRPGWLKWTVLGAGVAMGGLGAGLIAMDGGETSDPRYVHDSSTAGITLLSLGGAAIITAAVIYLLNGSGNTRRDVAWSGPGTPVE